MRSSSLKAASCALFLFGALANAQSNTIYYVKPTPMGTGDGLSWINATSLQAALGAASSGAEIWVAAGVYMPGAQRTDTFNLKPGVAVYGGFDPDNGAATFELRDWVAYPAVLSGDIDNNDTKDANGVVANAIDRVGANSYNVVSAYGRYTAIPTTTILDGFTITAGHADENNSLSGQSGGGLNCNGQGNLCSPTLSNLIFSGNSARNNGGAIYNYAGYRGTCSPALSNVTFTGNSANRGGALYNYAGYDGVSSPVLNDVAFSGNTASSDAGAMYNYSSTWTNGGRCNPRLINVSFTNNSVTTVVAGAIYCQATGNGSTCSPVMNDVTFTGNSASNNSGGALYLYGETFGVCKPLLTDVIFTDNTADHNGGALYARNRDRGRCDPQLTRVTFTGNEAVSGDGGAIFCYGAPGRNYNYLDIRLTDVALTGNIAGGDGGAMYNQGHFDPILERVTFTGNQASDFGGAMYNWNGGGAGEPFAYAELNHVSFEGNSATYGGAMSNIGSGGWTSPEMHNTSFTNNTASYGGALYNAAAQNHCHPTLVNVIFSNNSATSHGGAVYNSAGNGGDCSPTFTNTSFSGNSAGSLGGALYNLADPTGECTPVLSNSILWGNSAPSLGSEIYNVPGGTPGARVSMSYSLVEGQPSGGSVLDGTLPANNPLFVDVPNNNLRLQSGSPAINSGNNGASGLNGVTTDLADNPRFVGMVDLGAYEFEAGVPGDQAPQLRVVSLSGGILRLAADDIPAGQTFHLESSESLQGFLPADPSFDFTSLTVQPFEISVDPITTPRQFYRAAKGVSP